MEPVLRVLGAGSPHGDDQVGWRVVAALAEGGGPGFEAGILRQPVDLVDRLAGCDVLVIVDACRSGAPVGTVTVRPWPDPGLEGPDPGSTHGLGLRWALEMAHALGTPLPRVVLVGVEAGDFEPGGGLNPALHDALPGLVGRLRSLIAVEACASRGAGRGPRGRIGAHAGRHPDG